MESSKKLKNADFTEGPIFGKLIMFILPLMATGLLQTLYNASDMIIVGNFSPSGTDSMGAVGSCAALINLILNLFMGLATGAGVLVAQYIGAKKFDDVRKTVNTSVISSLVCGIILAIFGYLAAEPLLTLMGTPNNLLVEAVPYMKAYFVGAPAALLYNFLASILRSSGDSKRPLIFLSISGIANVGLNILMTLGFGMGAIGVGIATTVAQYISATMIFVYMCRADIPGKIHFRGIKIDKQKMLLIAKIGFPAGFQGMLFSLSNVIVQSTVNTYDANAGGIGIIVNGNSAAANIEAFVYICMNAMYHSTLTFVGQNVGAGKYERIKKIVIQNVLLVTAVGIILGGGVCLFGEQLLSIYAPDSAEVRAAGLTRLYMLCAPYFLCGLMDVGCGVVRGMGKAVLPMLVSLTGSCLLRIVWIYTVCPFHLDDIRWLYICYLISWAVTAAAHYICCIPLYRKMIRRRDDAKYNGDAVMA